MKYQQVYVSLFIVCLCLSLNIFSILETNAQTTNNPPLRLAVAGITHGHVPWILGRKGKTDVTLVGIYEQNKQLAERYAKTYDLSHGLFYTDLGKMLDAVKPGSRCSIWISTRTFECRRSLCSQRYTRNG